LKIGLQVFSVRNAFLRDRRKAFRRIADIGYRHVEIPVDFTGQDLFGTGEMDPYVLRSEAAAAGVSILAIHMFVADNAQLERAAAFLTELECGRAVIPAAFFTGADDARAYAETLNRYGRRLKEYGVQLYYHNHFHEFQRFAGRSVYEWLLDGTDPELVKFELDTYWAVRAGQDPVEWLRRLGPRCDLVHQKDLPPSVRPVNIFEELNENEPIGVPDMQRYGAVENFAEIGLGSLDIPAIAAAAREHAAYFIVEQDATTMDEMISAAYSYASLKEILRGA